MRAEPISQREARALRKRIKALESELTELRRSTGSTYPGRWMMQIPTDSVMLNIARTAARLGFVLVSRLNDAQDSLHFYAVPTEVPHAR